MRKAEEAHAQQLLEQRAERKCKVSLGVAREELTIAAQKARGALVRHSRLSEGAFLIDGHGGPLPQLSVPSDNGFIHQVQQRFASEPPAELVQWPRAAREGERLERQAHHVVHDTSTHPRGAPPRERKPPLSPQLPQAPHGMSEGQMHRERPCTSDDAHTSVRATVHVGEGDEARQHDRLVHREQVSKLESRKGEALPHWKAAHPRKAPKEVKNGQV
mmetsp:Transcript_4786/g.10149  ORF Transcript_4786/g.10149 Transcript_4786/m.10149 type:complete len:217 (-) Transcript_4786:438-1088(-)